MIVKQHDASARNRAYYERDDVRVDYRPDGGLDEAETALVERFLPAGLDRARPRLRQRARGARARRTRPRGRGPRHLAVDDRGGARRRGSGRYRCALPGRRRRLAPARAARARRGRLRLQRHRPPHARRQGRLPARDQARSPPRRRRPAQPAHALRAQPDAARACCATSCCRGKGLRPDEEGDGDQYVQRPPLGWLVSRAAMRTSTRSASARTGRPRGGRSRRARGCSAGSSTSSRWPDRRATTTSRACRAS